MEPYRFLVARWQNRYAIVPLPDIVRIEAHSDRVRIHAGRTYAHAGTFGGLCAGLPRDAFVRVHRSHAVAIDAVTEARRRTHGEYVLMLRDGTLLVTGRGFRDDVESALGLAAAKPGGGAAPSPGRTEEEATGSSEATQADPRSMDSSTTSGDGTGRTGPG